MAKRFSSRPLGIRRFFTGFISLALLTQGLPQAYATVEKLQLPSLRDDSSVSLTDYQGQVLLMSFFEPDCQWCYRQMKAFNRVREACDHSLQTLAVGVHGDRLSLNREVRRAKVSYPAVIGTAEFMQYIGEVPATPWTLIFNQQGQLLGKWQGYMQYEKIAQQFAEFCDVNK